MKPWTKCWPYVLNSNKNAYFIFSLFLYESEYVVTSKQFENNQQCMIIVFEKKLWKIFTQSCATQA